ncbi:MAG: folate-binding protein YgfZ [Paludibacterium sp.]|uniref:CAF17-like 4Fe-4S cluster assembly/insertion protein YgfZ n=1 Tax=Paludibacterium sp. TaxID=1917523 RepID=UPI0025FE1AF7|nr:hypothetical protein [Paludibacterium sp.]MBV8048038.1 folate-binding protein YgfZ [Paludibacterium sp.]MBV8647562.1 folate-binding protein YgfZ [Paludibacterium sp.]
MSTHDDLAVSPALNPDDAGYAAQVTALNQAVAFCRLKAFKLLRVAGEDAAAFLQGQLSNDIRLLDGGNAQYTSYSSAKGRLMASFLCWKSGSDYFLLVDSELSEVIVKRLSMFIMRSKVKLTVDDRYRLLGFHGEAVEKAVAAQGYPLPAQDLQLISHSETAMNIRLPGGWILSAVEAGAADDLLQHFPAGLVAVEDEAWSLLDIAAGIPWITLSTQELFVAQMANMDLFGAISFTKGCYPGQEIIARTRYLGKTKRRMYRLQLPICASCGADLYSPGMGDQSVGTIVNVARDGAGHYQALAVIQSASWETGIYLDAANTISALNLPLPYSLLDE